MAFAGIKGDLSIGVFVGTSFARDSHDNYYFWNILAVYLKANGQLLHWECNSGVSV